MKSLSKRTTKLKLNFYFCLIVGILCTLISSLFSSTYLGDSFGNFPIQLIVVLLLGLSGCTRFCFPLCLVAAIFCSYLNLSRIQKAIEPNKLAASNPNCPEVKIGSFNLLSKNSGYESVKKEIEEQRLDIILFQEFTPKWEVGLKNLLDKYPENIVVNRSDDFGLGIYSRLKISKKEIMHLVTGAPETALIQLDHCGEKLLLVNMHTLPPASTKQWHLRNDQLLKAASLVNTNERWIIMGDFNLTPFSDYYHQFRNVSKLNDARTELGLTPSWPTFVPPLWIPIDQLFYSETLELVDLERGGFNGSDHWPLIATFR